MGSYPTALKTGSYQINAYTVRYVQKMFPVVWVSKGTSSISDIEVDLDVGSDINMTVFFKKQLIFENTTDYLIARARLYDQEGNLKAAALWDYISKNDDKISWDLKGFGKWYQDGTETTPMWNFGYREPSGAFYPSYGIDQGTYTIEVDFYPIDLDGPIIYTDIPKTLDSWVNCLLCGEYGNPDRKHYYPFNHLGPYEQRSVVTVTVTSSGEVSPIFEVDLRGSVKGYAMGFNWKGELRTLAWATIYSGAAPDDGTMTASSFGGFFDMYLPSGSHSLKVDYAGMTSSEFEVSVTEGSDLMGIFFEMEQSGIPIPEFPIVGLVLVASLAASIYVLSRVRRKEE
jgi:hypothetical protein